MIPSNIREQSCLLMMESSRQSENHHTADAVLSRDCHALELARAHFVQVLKECLLVLFDSWYIGFILLLPLSP